MPVGFGIRLDPSARALTPDLWSGGSPARVMRLTAVGRSTLLRLRAEGVRDAAGGRLARRLTDAGLAHPVPPTTSTPTATTTATPATATATATTATGAVDVTVLVPVLDRLDALDRCLTSLGGAYPVVVVDDGSADAVGVARVARKHSARLVRREVNGGPAAARNVGLAEIASEFVAFLDSDCLASPDWIAALAGHLADPLVAAVAPRVTSAGGDGWVARYCRARGGLDLGERPGRVVPRSRVAYVPTAALVARTDALHDVARAASIPGEAYVFDPALRYGEDVDLVWRLHDAGWRVRYEPAVGVAHRDPPDRRELLRRRFRYGTSAAPLGRAHPDAIPPLVVHPWAAATVAALLAGRPGLAVGAFTATTRATATALRTAGVPTRGTTRSTAVAVGQTWQGIGRYLTQFAAPVLAAAALVPGRPGRRAAALSLLLGPSVLAWVPRRRELDPVRFVAAHLGDEIAYGMGVWAGCARHRTLVPLRPAVVRASRRTRPPARSQSGDPT